MSRDAFSITNLALIAVLLGVSFLSSSSNASDLWAAEPGSAPTPADGGSWYFAVSGDSRDCGDLIMPKIAHSIDGLRPQTPVSFYWHLGDFRRMFDIDCDMLKRKYPDFDCRNRPIDGLAANDMNEYLDRAWDDFIEHQVRPFGPTPVFLGIGNHELYAHRTRRDFQRKFQRWLTQGPLHAQRTADAAKHVYGNEGSTYYHFVRNGVDFIYMDNADATQFDAAQLGWLSQVLKLDAADPSIKAIIVGMHAALPFSRSSHHAMDASCQGVCSGQQAYDLLYRAQHAGPTPKHVYVLASHSHYFQENIYDTPAHQGQVLPGWIIGTAGAEQYTATINYGYLLVEVRPDGTINPQFKPVTRDMAPLAPGPGGEALTDFCFEQNKRPGGSNDAFPGFCACGAAR